MTLKEAVLKNLEDINNITNYLAVLSHINDKNYYTFGGAMKRSFANTYQNEWICKRMFRI